MTHTYLLLGVILSILHLGQTSNSTDPCKDSGCGAHFANQGVEAECVNVLHTNWTSLGATYNLSTATEDGLCGGDCCRCLTRLSPPTCTDVRGSCLAEFGGAGSCIDVRTGDLSNIDITVKPRGGICGALACCQCFKLKVATTTTTSTTTTATTIVSKGSLMAIGGYITGTALRSAEVLTTSCDFPLPEGRYGHIGVTTADGNTLVCGGFDFTELLSSCLQFNYQTKTWQTHSSLLSKNRYRASSVTLSSGVYVLGGQSGAQSSSDYLAKGSSTWTPGPNIPGGQVQYSCAAKLSESEFVILGGLYDRTQARVYNELTGQWREWPRLSVGVYGHSCVALGGDKVVMAGGSSNGATGRTVIFDTKTGSAREVASLNYPRYLAAMELYRGKAVILGGDDGSGSGHRSDGETWNMDTETWEEADIELNVARSRFSLVTLAEETDCD